MTDKRIDYINILLAVVVAVIALLVRMPSAFLVILSDDQIEAYTDDSGLPYFTDPDSYYHIRLVDTMLETGKIADTVSPDGEPWDMHSFYPEGRNGAYEPGIVYLTIALWKVFNLSAPIDISRVEFYLSGFMAMITALAAYITGCRINGKVCGFVAGILMSCAPEYVSRTSFGRFDTDFFVILLNVLLICFLIEMLRASRLGVKASLALVFVLTALVYANCWATQFSMLFAGLTLFSGFICSAINEWLDHGDLSIKNRIIQLLVNRDSLLLVGSGILILILIGITMGFSVVGEVFSSLTFSMTQEVSEGVLPNMYESIAELERPALVPDRFADWFRGYVIGSPSTVITGIGGAFAAVAAIGGLIYLFIRSVGKYKTGQQELIKKRECLIYSVVLGLWTITGLFLTRSGNRFIEMLAVPVGLLAGIFAGWIPQFINNTIKRRTVRVIATIIVVAVIVIPDMEGFFLSIRLPSFTDASAVAMKWIRENADDPDAVIDSWWDMGYFYESESGHPCLWDGGSQDPVRAILCSRAMVEEDMETSYRILKMLSCSGNAAINLLMEYTDPKTAFDTLWEVLPMNTKESSSIIADKCGMNIQNAIEVDKLIHPRDTKEIYLVLSYSMIKETGMYEYYSDWDFTGTQISSYKESSTDDEQEKLDTKRESYTMWRLYFDVEENPYFNCVFENYDGVEGIRVWRVGDV